MNTTQTAVDSASPAPIESRPRSLWAAKTLTHLAPGLGHLYCGVPERGLGIYFAGSLLIPILLLTIILGSPSVVCWLLLATLVAGLAIWYFAVRDIRRVVASSKGADYQLRSYNRWWLYALIVVQPLGYIIPVSMLVRNQMIEAFVIAGTSMAPSLLRRDRVLVDKRSAGSHTPARGDVIVFRCPGRRDKSYVKRVVGLPGESIRVDETGRVTINGRAIETRELESSELGVGAMNDEPQWSESIGGANYRVILSAASGQNSKQTQPAESDATEIPLEHVFVLGDNRGHSLDSREFGPVPIGDILGPVVFNYWPVKTWKRLGRFVP